MAGSKADNDSGYRSRFAIVDWLQLVNEGERDWSTDSPAVSTNSHEGSLGNRTKALEVSDAQPASIGETMQAWKAREQAVIGL